MSEQDKIDRGKIILRREAAYYAGGKGTGALGKKIAFAFYMGAQSHNIFCKTPQELGEGYVQDSPFPPGGLARGVLCDAYRDGYLFSLRKKEDDYISNMERMVEICPFLFEEV